MRLFSVVYSTETPSDVKLLPLPEEEFKKGSVKELQAFDDFRVRIMPVLGPLPAIFGLNIATYILLSLADKSLTDYLEIKNRKRLYASLERNLSERETRWQGQTLQSRLPITVEDIGFLFDEVYHGRSSIPPALVLPKAQAVRWNKSRPLSEDNLVFMNSKDAEKHEKECLVGDQSLVDVWGEEAVELIRWKSADVRQILAYRRP